MLLHFYYFIGHIFVSIYYSSTIVTTLLSILIPSPMLGGMIDTEILNISGPAITPTFISVSVESIVTASILLLGATTTRPSHCNCMIVVSFYNTCLRHSGPANNHQLFRCYNRYKNSSYLWSELWTNLRQQFVRCALTGRI